jgi:hypothetical protein
MTKSTKPNRRIKKVSTKPAAKSTPVASPARSGKKLTQKVTKIGSKNTKTNSNVIELKTDDAIIVKDDFKYDSKTPGASAPLSTKQMTKFSLPP